MCVTDSPCLGMPWFTATENLTQPCCPPWQTARDYSPRMSNCAVIAPVCILRSRPCNGLYDVCAVCAPRLYTLSPMCNDGVCLGGRFALLSIPEGTVQCGALLYHCWQPTVYVKRGREMGVSLAHGLGWPLTHSPCSALSAAAEAQSSITLTCTQTRTPVWEKCIYQAQRYANIGRHSNTS